MLGLDDYLASYGGGWVFALVVAVLLGLRHATDPDHLTAILTLRLSRAQKNPHLIGLGWGLGHAATMIGVGMPLILLVAEMPERVQQALELAVGVMIVCVAFAALWRMLRINTHEHPHAHHDGTEHAHVHAHVSHEGEHAHRTPRSAFAMGLLHGGGGSAGVVALILASQSDRLVACVALVVIALFSGLSMMGCSWMMCKGVDHLSHAVNVRVVAGVGAVASLAFGIWYCAAAVTEVWYPF